jgi:asparagine synthase (glutamine-hydrolysing)
VCGIVGIVPARGAPDRALLERITRTLQHRGPDDEGYYYAPEVGLGFRRLAIIDLETGNQPVRNEAGTVHAVLNGEIYNFRELRRMLEQAGHTFRSRGDAEVLPHLYEERGVELVNDLRGMFAFALWDAEKQELVLARDRFGEKPLYYTDALPGGGFAFASEMKALLAAGVSRAPDREALSEYLYYLYIPAPRSGFAAISKLEPGRLLRLRDGEVRVERYWSPTAEPVVRSEAEHVLGLRERVVDAVRSRLVADVPLGAFLSGGIDSAAVVAGMRAAHDGPIHTFTITFEGFEHYDESEQARASADHFGTDHHELRAEIDLQEMLPRIVDSFDEPFGNATAALTWALAGVTREHVKVALTGDGGDELFFGYPRYRGLQLADRYRRAPLGPLKTMAEVASRALPESTSGRHTARRVREFLSAGAKPPKEAYASWIGYFTPEMLTGLLVSDERAGGGQPHTFLDGLFNGADGLDLNEISRVELQSFLPYNVLEYADKMSMAHGLELRAPFVDHLLADYVASIPSRFKLRNGVSKWVLRQALARELPPEVLRRPKRGLNPPLGAWLAGPLRPIVRDLLDPEAIRRRGFLRPDAVARLLEEQERGRRDRSLHIWSLLVLEEWFRRRVDVGIA